MLRLIKNYMIISEIFFSKINRSRVNRRKCIIKTKRILNIPETESKSSMEIHDPLCE